MSRLARHRSATLWLQLLLIGGLVSVAVIVTESVRLARGNREMIERASLAYAKFAAWSYREHLVASLNSTVSEVLGPVNHGRGMHVHPRIPDAGQMGLYLPASNACRCLETRVGPVPWRYVGFTLGADTLASAEDGNGPKRGWDLRGTRYSVPVAQASGDDRWIHAQLSAAARTRRETEWDYDVFVSHAGARHRLVG